MAKKYERFIVKEAGGSILKDCGVQMILVDRETGVNYLMVKSGYGTGITPLLGADGKPIITPVNEIEL